MNYREILMILLKVIALGFIVYVSYTQGHYNATKECVKRAEKFNKEYYSLQDVEIIIFGEIQE